MISLLGLLNDAVNVLFGVTDVAVAKKPGARIFAWVFLAFAVVLLIAGLFCRDPQTPP